MKSSSRRHFTLRKPPCLESIKAKFTFEPTVENVWDVLKRVNSLMIHNTASPYIELSLEEMLEKNQLVFPEAATKSGRRAAGCYDLCRLLAAILIANRIPVIHFKKFTRTNGASHSVLVAKIKKQVYLLDPFLKEIIPISKEKLDKALPEKEIVYPPFKRRTKKGLAAVKKFLGEE